MRGFPNVGCWGVSTLEGSSQSFNTALAIPPFVWLQIAWMATWRHGSILSSCSLLCLLFLCLPSHERHCIKRMQQRWVQLQVKPHICNLNILILDPNGMTKFIRPFKPAYRGLPELLHRKARSSTTSPCQQSSSTRACRPAPILLPRPAITETLLGGEAVFQTIYRKGAASRGTCILTSEPGLPASISFSQPVQDQSTSL